MLITLKIIGDARGYREISFRKPGEYIIGRLEDAQCQVDDGRVSKHHCVFIVNPPDLSVKDLLSANGTIVDGIGLGAAAEGDAAASPLRELSVKSGSIITIGSTKIHIEVGIEAEDQAKAARWMVEGEKRIGEAAEYFKHVLEVDPAHEKAAKAHAAVMAVVNSLKA